MNNKTNAQETMYLSQYIISSPHSEYIFKQDFSVIFVNTQRDIVKQIVDKDGNIEEFPGIEYTDTLRDELGNYTVTPVVRYEALFELVDKNTYIMVWTVRPDGRYWMDSWGFGGEDYESLSLYAYIDADGNFKTPFRLYSIGYDFYGDYRLGGSSA